jgi:hypothetical protein
MEEVMNRNPIESLLSNQLIERLPLVDNKWKARQNESNQSNIGIKPGHIWACLSKPQISGWTFLVNAKEYQAMDVRPWIVGYLLESKTWMSYRLTELEAHRGGIYGVEIVQNFRPRHFKDVIIGLRSK